MSAPALKPVEEETVLDAVLGIERDADTVRQLMRQLKNSPSHTRHGEFRVILAAARRMQQRASILIDFEESR